MQTRLSRLFMTRTQISLGNQVLGLNSHPRKSPVSLRGGGGVMKIRFDSFYFPFFQHSTWHIMTFRSFMKTSHELMTLDHSLHSFAKTTSSKKRLLLQDNGTK